ncbi:MAG: hypothetical protein E6Q46_06555 [Flavobacterium sp.]|nr:MAG: hypothetical protein E6Q46_06555 [Flavobacterium sp.]
MKKIILFSLLALSTLSCKKDNTENAKKSEAEQLTFYKKLLIEDVAKSLKKEYSKELATISDTIIEKIATIQADNCNWNIEQLNDTIYLSNNSVTTFKKQLALVDSLYRNKKDYTLDLYDLYTDLHFRQLKDISFNENIIGFYWSPGQNPISDQYQKLILKDNDVIDLGNGLKLLAKKDIDYLVSQMHSKGYKNYEFSSEPGRNEISIVKNDKGNYTLAFLAYDEDDAGCCPTVNVSFETADFISITANSLKIGKD